MGNQSLREKLNNFCFGAHYEWIIQDGNLKLYLSCLVKKISYVFQKFVKGQ